MESGQSSRLYAVMALVWTALAVSQTALASRRHSVVDWLLVAGFAVLASAFVTLWSKARRRNR